MVAFGSVVTAGLPLLVDGASVILTGSTASIVAMPAFGIYDASKAALCPAGNARRDRRSERTLAFDRQTCSQYHATL
jgi:short-subunit dehydrogenase